MKSRKLKSENGSVLLLVVLTLTAIMGIVGLAMDAGQLYVTYQQAQAAADAAVLAGARDMVDKHGFATPGFSGLQNIPCGPASTQSPCVYAGLNGFGLSSPPDTVTIKFRQCPIPPGVTLNGAVIGPGSLICATVSRVVPTTFLRVLGTLPSTVTATAEAAILGGGSLTPILVTHPTLSGALALGASSSLFLCGGPNFGVQVNSNSLTAVQNGGTVDLSKGGPADSGRCDNGTGSSFRVVGPEAEPAGISLGTGQYFSSVSATVDPLANVNPPAPPAAPGTSTVVNIGANGCLVATCTLYSPGTYPAIAVSTNALFEPGIYYITGVGGFQATGGCMAMATGFTDPATGWTQNMLVYNNGGGTFSTGGAFGQGCPQNFLQGSPPDSAYQGILFFQDRNSPRPLIHNFAVIGSFAISGTIYMNNTNTAQYQTLNLTSGSVSVSEAIVVGSLTLNGGSLAMNVVPGQTALPQVALVQYVQ